ncbi:zinc finger protein 37 homolog [Dunckerocampus dactyliophorus]|uniref:zinc finger protein 37 homolog n=1 Tax=Dunckerocampus dactyliophorus TaxID=161453 RepID=UPI0024064399|nr:zinc finger protein 37 homolog [Dunckerocampus dactyliophorus]
MLKELIREILMAAADEIFALFERTIASYEEELSRAREETERQRQQLEAKQLPASKTEIVRHVKDVQHMIGPQEECQPLAGSSTWKQEDPDPPQIKEEDEELWIPQDGERLLGLEEADLTKLPLTVVSVKIEDDDDEPQADNLLAPLSDSDDTTSHSPEDEDRDGTQEPLSSDTDDEDAQQLIGRQEEHPPQGERSTLKQEDSQAPHIKEEERDLWITQDGACLLGPDEFDLNELQLTVVPVKTEDHEDKPPESSQLHHSPGEEDRGAEPPSGSSPQHMTTEADGDHCGGSQADNLLAPLSDSDDTTSHSPEDEDENDAQEPLSSDTDWEGDMRTQTDKKHSKKKTGKKCFNCLVCDRSFSHKGIFSRHMRTHTGEKRFCCSICSKPFSLKSNMVSHMRIHTGEKPFSCSICGDTFVQRSTLTSHMRTHTGEKPFSCSVCGDKFSQRSNLNGHKRTHTGEKPFSCAFCGKSFSCRSNMNAHMRTHTGEKPFSCPACGQMFSRKTKMTAHMLTHNGE